jgi:hypothetical protein
METERHLPVYDVVTVDGYEPTPERPEPEPEFDTLVDFEVRDEVCGNCGSLTQGKDRCGRCGG